MKKVGGVFLIAIGVILIGFGLLRILTVAMTFTNGADSAYGIGFLAGTFVVTILFALIGWKAIGKGRAMFSSGQSGAIDG
jgi:hypothetical protein